MTSVDYLGGRVLRLAFSDGLVRELDFTGTLTGVLGMIDDDAMFGTVRVDPASRTICWPGGIDLDPDVLHREYTPVSGAAARLIREFRQSTAV